MDKSTQNLLVKLALVGVAGYVIYKFVTKAVPDALKPVTDPISNAISNEIIWWTATPPINVNGSIVVQPSGALLDPVSYPITWQGSDPNNQFATIKYNGQTYVLGPHDANGNWPAVPASSLVM